MSQAFRESGIKFVDEKDRMKVARFTEVKDFGLTHTSQATADEVDINKIMARIEKGHTVMTPQGTPFYGDVSELGGLQEAIIKVQEADDLFMQYPAKTRERFNNDPVELIEFLENPENKAEALKLGLIEAALAVPEPPKAPAPAARGAAPEAPHS